MSRYFGFAQQVGLELGSLMPERLRHTIAFMSSLVTMTLNLDQVSRCLNTATDAAVCCRNEHCDLSLHYPRFYLPVGQKRVANIFSSHS